MLKHSFMKTALASLAITLCSTSMAADNYTTALNKLKASPGEYSWIKERSIENIDFASMILCIIRNTGANHQDSIDAGPYVAKVTAGMCDKNSSQTSSAATGDAPTGVDYEYFVVDTKRIGDKLDIKFWIRPKDKELSKYDQNIDWVSEIHAHVVVDLTKASQVGFEQLHWVHLPVDRTGQATSNNFSDKKGYGVIIPTKTGNDFEIKYANKQYFSAQQGWLVQSMNILRTGDGETTPISMTGFTKSFNYGNNNQVSEVSFKVAANKDRFVRRQFINGSWDAPICYDRSPSSVKFNTWDYSLFDETTEELKDISGSSDLSITLNGANYRGNYRMSDMWFPEVAVNIIGHNGENRTSSDAYPVKVQSGTTVKDGLLTMRHGGLRKVTNSETTLGDLKGVPFDVWVCTTSCTNKSIKWTDAGFVYADGSGAFNVPTTSNWWDIWLNSNGVGYRVRGPIGSNNQPDWTLLTNAWKAVSRTESRVSDTELATLANTTLNCVSGCPAVDANNNTRITGYSANDKNGNLNTNNGSGYTYKVSADGQLKLWNGTSTTGNNLVVSRFTEEATARANNWNGTDGFGSGALIPTGTTGFASLADLQSYFECTWDNSSPKRYICGWNKELPSTVTYYTWRTGTVRWDKDWDLRVDGHNPAMDDPLMVSYTCPANRDCDAGTKYVLRYEGNQNLNGIPNRCVKSENFNEAVDCNTYTGDKQWLNRFNLTKTSATATAATDFVADVKTGKKYLVLPQGSMEYYPVAGVCNLSTDTVTQGDINIDDYFRQDMVEIGAMPLDILKSKVVFQDGRPTKSLP